MPGKLLACVWLCFPAVSAELLLHDVTVVDVAAGVTRPHRSIVIRGDRIATIGARVVPPKAARVIEGRGRFVIPGLWDMHLHLRSRESLPRFLAQGITGVRDMGGDFERVKDWRAQIQDGKLMGPHIETCGTPVDGFPSDDPGLPVRVVRSPSEARTVYDSLDDDAVDFIGVRPRLPRDAYFALIERARKYYSPVAGPVPAEISAWEAVDNRQSSIDSMSGILLACSTEEKKLRGPYVLALERGDRAALRELEEKSLETFSSEKADALFHRMALFGTRVVPMLLQLRESSGARNEYGKLAGLVLAMFRSGVAIMSGTGDGLLGSGPDERLAGELELLAAAGLTPAEALRTATLEPAVYLDATGSLGAVEPGKIADLVLLDGDPLEGIQNLRRISAVIVGGKLFNRQSMQKVPSRH